MSMRFRKLRKNIASLI